MTETFFWVPTLYVLLFFVPHLRVAHTVATVFFSCFIGASVVYVLTRSFGPSEYGVLFALIELNLSNLTLLALSRGLLSFRERYTSNQVRAEAFERLAHTDLLTELPNRLQLDLSLAVAVTRGLPFSVIFVDIDGFKLVNDSLGHAAGDEVLQQLAARLKTSLQSGDEAFRISGDEFVLLCQNSGQEAARRAQEVLRDFRRSFQTQAQEVQLTASIGFSCFPQDATDASTLLKHADSAMYMVKSRAKNGVRRFEPLLDAEIEQRKMLELDFKVALERGELSLAYQPIYDLASGQMRKAEALLRWNHPLQGNVSPAVFIPLVESSSAILEVGSWVLETACLEAKRWRDVSGFPLIVTVNVAPVQFVQSGFVEVIQQALRLSGLPASALELEVTEGAVMWSMETVRGVLLELQRLGVRVAVDDFGTGYSSLSYLKDLPINCVKIDRSFLVDLTTAAGLPRYTLALIEAVMGIARSLDLEVVAEGIELQEQTDILLGLGCHLGQGFHLCRPVSGQTLLAMLPETQDAPASGSVC
jgi:diguanylate cyclase (GGDEF)-like protein